MLIQGNNGPEGSTAMRLLVAIMGAVIGYLLRPVPPTTGVEEALRDHMSTW
jgi:hypothetical protein